MKIKALFFVLLVLINNSCASYGPSPPFRMDLSKSDIKKWDICLNIVRFSDELVKVILSVPETLNGEALKMLINQYNSDDWVQKESIKYSIERRPEYSVVSHPKIVNGRAKFSIQLEGVGLERASLILLYGDTYHYRINPIDYVGTHTVGSYKLECQKL